MSTKTAAPAPATCQAAITFLLHAIDNGWAVAWQPGTDSGDAPYVTVRAVHDDVEVRLTWHTRTTGTYRLFTAMHKRKHLWVDTTLRAATALVTARGGGR